MPRASTAETGPAMVGPRRAEPASVAGALAMASSAVRTLPGPGGGVAAADGASNFFRAASAASALALRARSGRRNRSTSSR